MDFGDQRQRSIFYEVHRDLPREGPGNRASTARALACIDDLPARPRVLDVACGPGQQTLYLAALLPEAAITAIDRHPPFLAELERRAHKAGTTARIGAVRANMAALPFRPGTFDVIWCEGAAYIIGFQSALETWAPLLARGGSIALTEPVWLRKEVPEVVARNWDEYPAMTDAAGCIARIERAGLVARADFVLDEAAWWDNYYGPMAKRIEVVAAKHRGDAVAEGVLRECRDEIDVYRGHSDCYGYAFFIVSR